MSSGYGRFASPWPPQINEVFSLQDNDVENTPDLESLASIPQLPVDPTLCTNRNILPDFSGTSQCYCHHNSSNLPITDPALGQTDCFQVMDPDSMAPCGLSKIQPIDPILRQSLRPRAVPNIRSITAFTGYQGNIHASMVQGSNVGSINRFDEDLLTAPGNGASLLPTLNELRVETAPHASLNLNGVVIRPNKRPRTRDNKVGKVFACIYNHCSFEASSRKDIRRHMHSDKHQKDHPPRSPLSGRFHCRVPGCKDEGFSRRDNLLRHMSRVHKVELEREKPGRKRSRKE